MIVCHGIVCAVACWFILPLSVFAQSVDNPDSLFFRALQLQHTGNLKQAETQFRLLLNEYPDYHDARVQYGRLLAWNQRFEDAMVQFDSVLFVQPKHTEARFSKAQILSWSGRYRQSANIFLSLLEEDPKSARVLIELGNVYFAGGAPRTALQYYEKAYLQLPTEVVIIRGLARSHRKLGNEDLALYWYRRLLSTLPGDPEARDMVRQLMYKSDHEIRLHGSYETFNDKTVSEHTIAQAEYYFTLNEDWKPFLHFSRISKFGSHDTRYGGGAYGTFGSAFGIFFQVIGSPASSVAPDFDAVVEFNGGVVPNLELIGGYRFMRYDTLSVNVAVPGFTWYVRDDLWLIVRGYFGWVPHVPLSTAGTIALVVRPNSATTIRFGGFSGNEVFQATSIREVSNLKSSGGFMAFKNRVSAFLAVEGLYQYTSRNLHGNSHLLTLTVSTLF